jgi:hypothetical protein
MRLEWNFMMFGYLVGVDYNIGDEVTCSNNFYGSGCVCKIDKIYYRIRAGRRVKFFRLVFVVSGEVKTINTHYKGIKRFN